MLIQWYCIIAILFMVFYASRHSRVEELAKISKVDEDSVRIGLNILIVMSVIWPVFVVAYIIGAIRNANVSRNP